MKCIISELQLYLIHLKQCLILSNYGVLGFTQDPYKHILCQSLKRTYYRQTSDKFRYHAE